MKGGICISISIKLREQMAASSSITRMFEEKEFYDFTLGNPEIETPPKFTAELKRIINNPFPGRNLCISGNGIWKKWILQNSLLCKEGNDKKSLDGFRKVRNFFNKTSKRIE